MKMYTTPVEQDRREAVTAVGGIQFRHQNVNQYSITSTL